MASTISGTFSEILQINSKFDRQNHQTNGNMQCNYQSEIIA